MHSARCLPRQHGGHVKRSRLLGACFSAKRFPPRAPPDHVLFIFRFLTTKQTQRGFRSLAVELPLLFPNTATKKLTEIVSLLGRNLGTVHPFGGGQLVDASSGLDASHVVTSFSSYFPFGKPQSLPDLVEPAAFGTVQQSRVGALLSREERRSLPVPSHLLQHAVYCGRWPITHFITIRMAAPNTLQLCKGLKAFALPCVSTVSDTDMKHSVRDRRGDL